MRSISLTAFALALLLPLTTEAQFSGLDLAAAGEGFTLSVDQQYPQPHSRVTVSVFSDTLDLANATMTVLVGGKEIYAGAARAFPVTLGGAGNSTVVKATITSQGTTYSKSISIQPQDVVLIAEPISSAPPLYAGKSAIPFNGSVRFVALANLRDASDKTSTASGYSYSWTVDGTTVFNSSGIGKSSIIVESPLQYRDSQVSVDVKSQDGKLVGGAVFTFSAVKPTLRIYENDPLLGVRYERAISDTYAIRGAESTLYAAPFSLPTTSGAPIVQWFLNDALAQTGNFITLRPAGDGEGSASLSLTASVDEELLSQDLSLLFGKIGSSNIFGL